MSAYIIAPVAGLTALWLCIVVYDLCGPNFSFGRDLLLLPWMYMMGGFICAIVEIAIVTPLLLGFERHQWKWLNGWSACAIGFLLSQSVWFAIGAAEILGVNATQTTWTEVTLQSAVVGVVGMVAALCFRLIAVRVVMDD